MRRTVISLLACVGAMTAFAGAAFATPVEDHGALSVKGNRIVDAQGKPTKLNGVSFFWSTNGWGQEKFYNPEAVDFFAREWKVSLVRAAMGIEPKGSYYTHPEDNKARVHTLIDGAVKSGVYVIIDWHAHKAHDRPDEAVAFFAEMAKTYGHLPNVIYEIYNEPLNTADWARDVKPYSQRVIDAIRQYDPDNLILVGSPTWSQDVDIATADPVTGGNIAYVLHFYAGTHKQDLRDKADVALKRGYALFVSEWGTVNANGDGAPDIEETRLWQDYMRDNCLSQANWAVSDRKEGASIFKPDTSGTGPWTQEDLTPSGVIVRDYLMAATTTCD